MGNLESQNNNNEVIEQNNKEVNELQNLVDSGNLEEVNTRLNENFLENLKNGLHLDTANQLKGIIESINGYQDDPEMKQLYEYVVSICESFNTPGEDTEDHDINRNVNIHEFINENEIRSYDNVIQSIEYLNIIIKDSEMTNRLTAIKGIIHGNTLTGNSLVKIAEFLGIQDIKSDEKYNDRQRKLNKLGKKVFDTSSDEGLFRNLINIYNQMSSSEQIKKFKEAPFECVSLPDICKLLNIEWNGEDIQEDNEQLVKFCERNGFDAKEFAREFNSKNKERVDNNKAQLKLFPIVSVLGDELQNISRDAEGKLLYKQGEELNADTMYDLLNLEEKAKKQLKDNPGTTNFVNENELIAMIKSDDGEIRQERLSKIDESIEQTEVDNNGGFDKTVEKKGARLTEERINKINSFVGDNAFLKLDGDNLTYNINNVKSFLRTINADKFYNNNFIKVGSDSRYAWLSAVQILLNDEKKSDLTVDGEYKRGGETYNAVLDFQKKYNLEASNGEKLKEDGIPGPKTLDKLLGNPENTDGGNSGGVETGNPENTDSSDTEVVDETGSRAVEGQGSGSVDGSGSGVVDEGGPDNTEGTPTEITQQPDSVDGEHNEAPDGNEVKQLNERETGYGSRTFQGDVFEGNWENGRIDGVGKAKYANGDTYEGGLLGGDSDLGDRFSYVYKHGYGEAKYSDGGNYNGEFTKGCFSKGKFDYNDVSLNIDNGNLISGDSKLPIDYLKVGEHLSLKILRNVCNLLKDTTKVETDNDFFSDKIIIHRSNGGTETFTVDITKYGTNETLCNWLNDYIQNNNK